MTDLIMKNTNESTDHITTTTNHRVDRNDAKELKHWLVKINCQQHYSKFIEQGITMDLVPELDTNSLKELGIFKLGDRLRLEIAISNLKAEHLKQLINIDELYNKLNLKMSNPNMTGSLVNLTNNNSVLDVSNSNEGTLTQLSQNNSSSNLPIGNMGSNNNSGSVVGSSGGVSTKDSNKNITFILQDGSIKRVNVTGCFNAQAIKRKVLKKLGFKSTDAQFDTYIHSSPHNAENILYGRTEPTVTLLYDVELVTICYSPERLEKHRIMLIPKNENPTAAAIETSKKIMNKYKKQVNTSKTELTEEINQFHTKDVKAHRSTLRNFFGQRPPSELISSNLAEYFPDTRQKDLEQTVRNSVRHSVRLSRRFNLPTGAFSASSFSVNKRQSILSNSTGFPSNRTMSISSGEQQASGAGGRRVQRTIGDVMVNSITAIDEAVNSSDTLSVFSKPSTSFNNQVPQPLNNHDTRSIISSKSLAGGTALHRISIAANYNDNPGQNRLSTIELLNPSDSEGEDGDDYTDFANSDSGGLSSSSGENGPPENWLKGARIGSGSFGTVYLGMNPFTGELMAVKQIPLVPETDANNNSSENLQKNSMQEQQREMMLLKELNHENIVRYFGSSTDENYLNIFLEYVPGGSVQTMLNSYGPFEEPLIRNFIRQVLIGLSYLHGEDIIHRDIKGANILIDIKGTVKIGDFGISKKVSTIDEEDEDFKKTGKRASLQGSVFWMAPEVVKQTTYTKKADIWSVGCLIVEMFTGRHPFPELSQMQALFKIGNHITPTIPEWCTVEAKEFLTKTFEINFEMRPDAVELLAEQFLNPLIMSKQ
ncbi:Serine/threonine-protein kinase STE11 [Candida viswanathii]|uniref:mitogen-activated protein kinase kinase kinase n=1 Tax=Candida viswanathii TaxID=5486 RepID=A0A367YQ13_9ASCO|nr:Serine/threonine-protein kinase STE11 [Candida viswanathii]